MVILLRVQEPISGANNVTRKDKKSRNVRAFLVGRLRQNYQFVNPIIMVLEVLNGKKKNLKINNLIHKGLIGSVLCCKLLLKRTCKSYCVFPR
jgi:hypothetical protein